MRAPFEWIAAVLADRGIDINDPLAPDVLAEVAKAAHAELIGVPIRLHGEHTQALFAYVVASLGEAKLVKLEESGLAVLDSRATTTPDYRVVLPSGKHLLVEVKNRRERSISAKLRIKASYLAQLEEYAVTAGGEVLIATYWSSWRIWTLNSPSDFVKSGSRITIDLPRARFRCRMSELGDRLVGVLPPMELKLSTTTLGMEPFQDPDGAKGYTSTVRVEDAELFVGGVATEDADESAFALYLMMYGGWSSFKEVVDSDDEGVCAIRFVITPEECDPRQKFAFVGSLSSMISNAFRQRTGSEHAVSALTLRSGSWSLKAPLPAGHKGKDLRLWWFEIKPNYEKP